MATIYNPIIVYTKMHSEGSNIDYFEASASCIAVTPYCEMNIRVSMSSRTIQDLRNQFRRNLEDAVLGSTPSFEQVRWLQQVADQCEVKELKEGAYWKSKIAHSLTPDEPKFKSNFLDDYIPETQD